MVTSNALFVSEEGKMRTRGVLVVDCGRI